jgi:uncharacterized membrane protein YccC
VKIPGFELDASRAMTALCGAVAMLVAYWFALRFEWNSALAAITVAIMQGATWGITLDKISVRLLGTLVGAAMGIVMVAAFGHDRELFIIAMALWTGFCVWGVQGSQRPYAWLVTLLTSAIIGWPGGTNPANVFESGIVRLSTTVLGLMLSGLAFGVFWPKRADRKFEMGVQKLLTDGRKLLAIARSQLENPNQQNADAKSLQAELILSSASLPELLAQARTENPAYKRFYPHYQNLCQQLEDFAIATASVSDAVWNNESGLLSGNSSRLESYARLFEQLDQCCLALSQQFALASEGNPTPHEQQSDWEKPGSSLSELEGSTTPAVLLLVERCRLFHRSSSQVFGVIRSLRTPDIQTQKHVPHPASNIAWSEKLRLSTLAMVQMVVVVYFVLVTNWPLALYIAVITAVLVFKNSVLPVSLATGTLVKSMVTLLPVALILHFLIMPYFDSFWELAPVLGIVFFYLVYGMTSPNPFQSLTCLLQAIVINILISVTATPPNYEFAPFSNIYIGLSSFFAIVCFIAYVFETRNPRVGFTKLVTAICGELAAIFKGAGDGSDRQPGNGSRRIQHSLVNQYNKLNQVFGVIKYQGKPGIQPQQVQAVIDAAGTMVLRGIWMELGDRYQEQDSSDANNLRACYTQTLAAVERSMSELQLITVGSIDNELLRRLGTDERRLEHEALVDALTDFQRKLNAVDWQKWTQNYF